MKIMLWILMLPIHIGAILLRYPLAPVAVLLFSSKDKRRLVFMKWLETIDNDLSGDSGWQSEHIKGDPLSYWNRVKWLWRNGGNALNYGLLGCDAHNLTITEPADGLVSFFRYDGYWQLRAQVWVFYVYWGWGLFGQSKGRCKYTFTTKIKLNHVK